MGKLPGPRPHERVVEVEVTAVVAEPLALPGLQDDLERLGTLRDELGLSGLVAELNPGGLTPLERMQRTLRILTPEVIPALR